jgi:hypothetical protein
MIGNRKSVFRSVVDGNSLALHTIFRDGLIGHLQAVSRQTIFYEAKHCQPLHLVA